MYLHISYCIVVEDYGLLQVSNILGSHIETGKLWSSEYVWLHELQQKVYRLLLDCFVANWRHNELREGLQTYHNTFTTFSLHCTIYICTHTQYILFMYVCTPTQ